MFNRKQRIIETQKALIADLKEEIEHNQLLIRVQHQQIMQLIRENKELKAINSASNIDFPNSQKGGSDSTGAINVSNILQH